MLVRVRADPQVRRAAAKVGRLPARPVLETLPPGFDPVEADPPPALRPDSV